MKKNYFICGLVALTLGGCARNLILPLGKETMAIKYEIQPNGLRVPLFAWGKADLETTRVGPSVYEKRTIDLNKDKSIDLAEITFFETMADYNYNPAGRILLEDKNWDGVVDVIYTDITKDKLMPGADGSYESATTASQLFLEAYGVPPPKRLLKMENFIRLMIPDEKETMEEFMLRGDKK